MPIVIRKPLSEFTNELLPDGEYPAVVTKATDGFVKAGKNSGAEQIELMIRVDNRATIRDYLTFTDSMSWKLNQFMHATCLGKDEEEVELKADTVKGLILLVKIAQKEITKLDGTKMIVNTIERFIQPPAASLDMKSGNEIPF